MSQPWIAAALVKHLREEWTPPRSVRSERLLDRSLRDHVRRWVREQCRSIRPKDVKHYVAGHEDDRLRKKHWTESKAHQVVRLWGAGKTSDLFIYHEKGRHSLPKGGISLEIKYVSRKTGEGVRAESYASAITTAAGQLLAYSIRHAWTIGFVWIDGARLSPKGTGEAYRERNRDLLRRLPRNATLIVRFRS